MLQLLQNFCYAMDAKGGTIEMFINNNLTSARLFVRRNILQKQRCIKFIESRGFN